MFWIITKWKKITEKQTCEDQIVTFKQSHILLYQGLLFLTRSTCVIVDARSHTCKSHDFIPRYDISFHINGHDEQSESKTSQILLKTRAVLCWRAMLFKKSHDMRIISNWVCVAWIVFVRYMQHFMFGATCIKACRCQRICQFAGKNIIRVICGNQFRFNH